MDLRYNSVASFTRWVVKSALLREPFVLIDVGVQGGENVRWHLLEDYLVVHGFDAIKEIIQELNEQNSSYPSRHYHWLAAGNVDEERDFYFNTSDPCSSSLYRQGADRFALLEARRDELRRVKVRRLDTLLNEGAIPPADFVKCDVEGYEKEVFTGARQLLQTVLAVECETNFGISQAYPKSHYCTIQELLLEANLLTCDLSFNRVPRASFVRALSCKPDGDRDPIANIGKPATLNVLFCRDPIAEADQPEIYPARCQPISVDQLIKIIIVYEVYGLPDIAADILERFAEPLSSRMDVEKAIHLLLDVSREQYESMVPEIQGLKNWVDAYKGQVEELRHELATAQSRFAQAQAEIEARQMEIAGLERRIATAELDFGLDAVPARALSAELGIRVRRRLAHLLHRPAP